VASQVAGRTIVPGGPKRHVRDQYLTLFIVRAVSGLVGARLGVGDNLIRHAQRPRHAPDAVFCSCIELTDVGLCLHGSIPRTGPCVADSGFNPAYTPPLPPPGNFAMEDVIGNQTTLGAVGYSSDPAQHGLSV